MAPDTLSTVHVHLTAATGLVALGALVALAGLVILLRHIHRKEDER